MSKEPGRIFFPGNPWPKGHAIKDFQWTGHVEPSSGIWFDLHLETEAYSAADPRGADDADLDNEGESDWKSKTVWANCHSCTLSSTKWTGLGHGFLAATSSDPLDWSRLNRRTFAFDRKPKNLKPPRPFQIYLTGSDAVCDHKIDIQRERGKKTFSFDWSGRIALSYSGDNKFRYGFKTRVAGIRLAEFCFRVPCRRRK